MPPDQLRAAVYVEKGGVGKTTTAAHVATALATDHDLDVLLVDLAGKQNDLATHFGLGEETDEIDAPVSAVFREDWQFIRENIDDVVDRMIYETGEGVDLVPSDPGLDGADNDLASVSVEERYTRLDAFLSEDVPSYDIVILDLPGKSDNIGVNGLVAAGNVIAPVKPGSFERAQLAHLQSDLEAIREDDLADVDLPRGLHLTLILTTMYRKGRNLHESFVEEMNEKYPDLVGPAVVPRTEDIAYGQDSGQTLFAMDDDELYNTGKRAREAYRETTNELLNRLQ